MTQYLYDNLGREVQEDWMDGPTIVRSVTYQYDAGGELTHAWDYVLDSSTWLAVSET